jgi:TATA-box binding protein (TBP) (component of TFIID and TFIIIB)
LSVIIFICNEMTSSSSSSDYSVNIINTNYRSSYGKRVNLKTLNTLLPNISKLHIKPSQLVIKDPKGTIIFFSNGKMRIMGCNDELEATFLCYKYTAMLDSDCIFQPVYQQTMTVKVTLNYNINLHYFAKICFAYMSNLQYEPELFPAVLLKSYKPISVNVFSSGKIIICGVKDIQQVDDIMRDLIGYLSQSKSE